jgi:hypothetical protein
MADGPQEYREEEEEEGTARVSVTLPVAVDLPARGAVPVQLRDGDGRLRGWLPADGRYHEVPAGRLLYLATRPDGRLLQASTRVQGQASARITLRGDLRPRQYGPAHAPTLLDQQKTALRFYVQSSLDSYRQSRAPSLSAAAGTSSVELRLKLTSHTAGVQFLQPLSKGAFPINVAYADSSAVKLVRLERRLAADIAVADPRVQLALDYLDRNRTREAVATLELQGEELLDARAADARSGPVTALVVLHVLRAASSPPCWGPQADELAERYPDIADFSTLAAECATVDRTAACGRRRCWRGSRRRGCRFSTAS